MLSFLKAAYETLFPIKEITKIWAPAFDTEGLISSGTRPDHEHWYANICPDIDDLSVIEDAKTIVDVCYPQTNSTFFGGLVNG